VRGLATIALVGLLAVGGCGCGGSDDDPSPPTTRRPPSTTSAPPTTASVESQVEEAYLAYWEMTERLLEAPDPDDPEIAERATGQVLGQLSDSLTTLRAQGHAVRSGPEYAHNLLSVDVQGDTGVVLDCAVDDAAVIDVASSEMVDERLVTVLLETTLRYDGHWLVAEVDQQDSWEGKTTCDR
jgi:hypothetical protein